MLRRRLEYPELKRAVRAQCERFAADVVLIEDKASGTQLIQELVAEGLWAATRYQPQADKVMRLFAQTAVPGLDPGIENGFVHLPEAAPWLGAYLDELTSFPHSRHDDQVDFDGAGARLAEARRPRGRHLYLLPDARRAPEAERGD